MGGSVVSSDIVDRKLIPDKINFSLMFPSTIKTNDEKFSVDQYVVLYLRFPEHLAYDGART